MTGSAGPARERIAIKWDAWGRSSTPWWRHDGWKGPALILVPDAPQRTARRELLTSRFSATLDGSRGTRYDADAAGEGFAEVGDAAVEVDVPLRRCRARAASSSPIALRAAAWVQARQRVQNLVGAEVVGRVGDAACRWPPPRAGNEPAWLIIEPCLPSSLRRRRGLPGSC